MKNITNYGLAIIGTIATLLLLTNICNASIDIYYPDNSSTQIWVANQTNPDYNYYIGDSITTDNYTCVVIRNQITDSVNLIEEPITFVNSFTKIFYAVVFCFAIIALTFIFRRILA